MTNNRDIGAMLDEGVWSPLQQIAVLLAALSILLDGFDGQMIGYAIPTLVRQWGVSRSDFAPVVASGLIGMAFGSGAAGLIADRFGRRRAVLGSVLVFGLATAAIGLSRGLVDIAILRLIAGLGVGGALPTSTTMAAEFTPVRYRTMAVTATIVCVPGGGMLAGLVAGSVLPALGWRSLFAVAGLVPLVLLIILWRGLPESPRWLARHPERWPVLAQLLTRMARPTPLDAQFHDPAEERHERHSGIGALFRDGNARTSILLWTAYFLCLFSVYTAISWVPTMLSAQGLSLDVAGRGLTGYNAGGVIGALAVALAITRFGSRWPLVLASLAAAVTAWWLSAIDPRAATSWLLAGLFAHGLFANAVQSTVFALCAHVYPTRIRATGAAGALVFGRLGAIASAFAGVSIIVHYGGDALLQLLGVAMAGVAVAIGFISRQIPPRKGGGV